MKNKISTRPKTKKSDWNLDLGANLQKDGSVSFKVWAPHCENVGLKLITAKKNETLEMKKDEDGYFSLNTKRAQEGTNYYYLLDNERKRPDPASRFQPHGVHGSSEVRNPSSFKWSDQRWRGHDLEDILIYELHIGTFTESGNFDEAIEKIPYLKKLGVTCVEVMPLAQFPGIRNWGYDGVGLFAVQNSYGGPLGFKKFVDVCHAHKISVCLDVVYNHLGPEGNYLSEFGPYFTGKYITPWGDAFNYDDEYSDHVRHYILSNLLYWTHEFHVDCFRLDAVHSILDMSPSHMLREMTLKLADASEKLKRKIHLFAESDMNDVRIIKEIKKAGYGVDAQWSDDFHHALHVCLTNENRGYYADYNGIEDLALALKKNFVYDGRYSLFRKRNYGTDASKLKGKQFIHCIQNHDQIGNRPWGDRLSTQVSFEAQKVSAVLLLLAPAIPLLWMGQEYGEKAPFQYFIDHHDASLVQAVRKGRKREFASFGWDELPDPADPETFLNSKLNWKLSKEGRHELLLKFYTEVIRIRKKMKILKELDKAQLKVKYSDQDKWISLQYRSPDKTEYGILVSLSETERVVSFPFGVSASFIEMLNTEDEKYGGFLAGKKRREHRDSFLLSSYGAMIGYIEK